MSEQLLSEAIKAIESRAEQAKEENQPASFVSGLLVAADIALAVGQQRIGEET